MWNPQEILTSVGWMWPAYMRNGSVWNLAKEIRDAGSEGRAVLEREIPRFYGSDYLAVMLVERYSKVPVVREFRHLIAQAFESAALGNYGAACATLLPVIEGILREIGRGGNRDVRGGRGALSAEIEHLIGYERERQNPAWEERVMLLQGFKDFFDRYLYVHTEEFDGEGELNRHGIVHGIFRDFSRRSNFCILVSILDQLTFAMTLRTSGISALAPDDTAESRQLAAYYRLLARAANLRPPLQ